MLYLTFADAAPGAGYHGALVDLRSRTPMHGHVDFYELMLVTAGTGRVRSRSTTEDQAIAAGSFLYVCPGDSHQILITSTRLRFYNLAFPRATWRGVLDTMGVSDEGVGTLQAPVTQARAPDRLVQTFARAVADYHDEASPSRAIEHLAAIVGELHRTVAEGGRRASMQPLAPAWLNHAREEMRVIDNLRDGVPRMVQLACVSSAYLSRAMAKYFAQTPTEFVTGLRLARACLELTTTTAPIGDIASELGFSSPAYFSRVFHMRYGLSPRTYRDAHVRTFVPEAG